MKAGLEFLSLKGDTDICSVNKCERMLELSYSASLSGSFASFVLFFCFTPILAAQPFQSNSSPLTPVYKHSHHFTPAWLLCCPLADRQSWHCPWLLYTSFILGAAAFFKSKCFNFPFHPDNVSPFPSRLNSLPERKLFLPLQRSLRSCFHNQFNHRWALQNCPNFWMDKMQENN